jgi:lipoprotein NlpI
MVSTRAATIPALTALAFFSAVLPFRAAAQPAAAVLDCQGSTAPEKRQQACSALLDGGHLGRSEAALAHYYRGLARHDVRDEESALTDLATAISLDPDVWPAHWLRAEIFARRRDYDAATREWGMVIDRKPQLPSAYGNRADMLDDLGHTAEAIWDYTKAIELGPPAEKLVYLHIDRGVAYTNSNQFDRAEKDFSEAIRLGKDTPRGYLGRGRLSFLRGDFAKAADDFAKAADLDQFDGYAALWLFLAQSRAGRDGIVELRRRANRVKETAWPRPIVQVMLGELRADEIGTPQHPADWSEAVRKSAAICELSFYLGELRLAKRDRIGARDYFRQAVNTGMREYVEYRAAEFELQRLAH